jgi:hypothetical protein
MDANEATKHQVDKVIAFCGGDSQEASQADARGWSLYKVGEQRWVQPASFGEFPELPRDLEISFSERKLEGRQAERLDFCLPSNEGRDLLSYEPTQMAQTEPTWSLRLHSGP